MRTFVDGLRSPSINGTGHEDDHLGGWSTEFLSMPFTLPMNGEPKSEILWTEPPLNGKSTMYRLWPGLTYLAGVRHSIEHGCENGADFDYHGTVFYYAQPGVRLVETDRLAAGDAAGLELHAFAAGAEFAPASLTSSFEGPAAAVDLTASHAAHRSAFSFTVAVRPDNQGVVLRRLFDQLLGRQAARVLVEGEDVGTWYVVEANDTRRWAERDFFVPAAYTGGLDRLGIEIVPGPDLAWDWAELRALSVVP
jgi:hypothetical protein